MKYIKELLIAVLLLAVVALWYNSNKTKDKLKEFDAKEKQLKARLDSIQKLQHQADLHALQVMTELETAKKDLAYQGRVTEKIKLRYEALRNIKPVNLSDAQIDSAVARLYPIR